MAGGITVDDARLEVWHQNNPSEDEMGDNPDPDEILDGPALKAIGIDAHAQEYLDEAALDIDLMGSDYGEFGPDVLRVGDRVRFVTTINTSPTTVEEIDWMGRIQPTSNTRQSARPGILNADAVDFVGDILANRRITNSYIEEDAGAIIRDICRRKASEMDATSVPDLGVTTDQFFKSKDCWEAIIGLAALADCLIRQDGRKLLIDPITALPEQFALTTDDYILPWDTKTDDDVKNNIRVDSGTNRKEEDAQEVQDDWTRVTETSRMTYRLRARKSQIHSVELRTRKVSDEDLHVRLQADEGGAPIAINDGDSDIAETQRKEDNITGEGWTTFFLPDHTLPDRDPWLIVETSGSEGHDIGVNTSGTPTYRSFYPHPLNFESSDTDSIREYGLRELRITRENLDTLSAARDAVRAELARRAWPSKTVSFEAASARAHSLQPGDIIHVDNPSVDATGDFIVVETGRTYDSATIELETKITAEWRKGILAPR